MMTALPYDDASLENGKHNIIARNEQHHHAEHNITSPGRDISELF